jgi:hypothetical protein
MAKTQVDHNGNLTGPLSNGILDVVSNELKLDHYYLPQQKLVMVKIDYLTLDNSVLNDW